MALTTNDLNCYILPGRGGDARVGLEQAKKAEERGFRGVFLGERWDMKELGSMMGALTQVTNRVNLVAGLTHFGTRHPLVQAGMANTLQTLSGGRYILGYGRSVPSEFAKQGIPVPNIAGMAEFVTILRRLWAGETVSYSGPLGEFPSMCLGIVCNNPPPLLLGAVGPKTLALAGTHFDGVVLHPFLTTEAVSRSVAIVRHAARKAGRDPSSLMVYATVVLALDTITDKERADLLEARAVSYFMHQELGPALARANGWDERPARRLSEAGISDFEFRQHSENARELMATHVKMLPSEWLTTGAAVGSVSHCIARLGEYLAAGANQILLHGATPDHQGLLVAELARHSGA
jgi:5,10-methylenetetrahydromethanopterin reductase